MRAERKHPSRIEANGRGGPVRTLRVGERLTVYGGDLEIVCVRGQRVTVRLHPASSMPPPMMVPAKERQFP